MKPPDSSDAASALSMLLRRCTRGEDLAAETLMPRVVEELRAIARAYLASQSASHSLQPSALVNEAYLKLFGGQGVEWNDRVHFFALAARAMRQILIDHARHRRTTRAGGGERPVSLHEPSSPINCGDPVLVLDLHAALEELAELDERQARIVELRYFAGIEVSDVAALMGVSKTTVEREWRGARAWLGRRMSTRSDGD